MFQVQSAERPQTFRHRTFRPVAREDLRFAIVDCRIEVPSFASTFSAGRRIWWSQKAPDCVRRSGLRPAKSDDEVGRGIGYQPSPPVGGYG
jgi:hypothetical protein